MCTKLKGPATQAEYGGWVKAVEDKKEKDPDFKVFKNPDFFRVCICCDFGIYFEGPRHF